jgi:hypothetical protein
VSQPFFMVLKNRNAGMPEKFSLALLSFTVSSGIGISAWKLVRYRWSWTIPVVPPAMIECHRGKYFKDLVSIIKFKSCSFNLLHGINNNIFYNLSITYGNKP